MKNKKGVELATKAIIGICLAVAIILLTFSFFSEAFNTFLGTKDASIHNFHNLHNKIKEMLNNPMENIMTEQAFPFYISSGNADTQEWILIGIDSTWDDEKKVDGNEDESIPRPAQCPEDRACLCLYKQTGGKDYDEPPEMCKHFNQPNVYISGADGYERFYGHENKEDNIKEDENWQARIKAREKYYTDNNLPLPESIVYTLTNMPEDSPYKHDDNQGKAGFNDGYSKNYIYDPERPYLTVGGDTGEGEDVFRGIDQFNFSAFFPVNYEYLILRHEEGTGCKKTKEDNIEVCDEHWDDGEQESRMLYIEKYQDIENDKIHILISERNGYINERAISAERLKQQESEQESEQDEQPEPTEGNSMEETFTLINSQTITIATTLHHVNVTAANDKEATLTIQSKPITITITLNNPQDIDTDQNGINDLRITYLGLDDHGNPSIRFTELQVAGTTPSTIEGQCFPVAENSIDQNQGACGGGLTCNFGSCRSEGERCHVGYDIFTKSPGHILAIAPGTVTNIAHFYHCKDGWGGQGNVKQVIVDHGDYVVNYGEIDEGKVEVKEGDSVIAGQILGVASHCGMLHFELYEDGVTQNIRWFPTNPITSCEKNICRRNHLSTKDSKIQDPTETINNLKDNLCSTS